MNILQIIQTVALELGLTAPTVGFGSTDMTAQQLLALSNRECNELTRSTGWTNIATEHVVNLESPFSATATYAEGSEFLTNVSNTTGVEAYSWIVTGEGMPLAQRVVEVIDATTIRLEMLATATPSTFPFADISFAKDTYALPSDFDRFTTATFWDRTNHWQLIGPTSPQYDQYFRSGIVATGPRLHWREIGNGAAQWRIWPPPTSASTPDALVFEYLSNGWVRKIDGTYADVMTADTDVPILNQQAIILGVKWRMWQIKGFDWKPLQAEYVDFVNRLIANNGGMADLSLNKRAGTWLLSAAQVQDGNYPGP